MKGNQRFDLHLEEIGDKVNYVVRREMLWVHDGEGTLAVPLLIELLKYGHQHCEVTILEGILYADIYKEVFMKASEMFGADIFAYYYDLPFEETLNRHSTKENRFDFGKEHMRKWWKEKDYLDIITEKIFTKDVSFEGAVDMIYDDVRCK